MVIIKIIEQDYIWLMINKSYNHDIIYIIIRLKVKLLKILFFIILEFLTLK